MVKLRLTSLIGALFKTIVDIGARSSCRNEKSIRLTIIRRRRVVPVFMHGQHACRWIEVVGKGNISGLPGRSADCYTRVRSTIGPHISAGSIQYLDTSLINPN